MHHQNILPLYGMYISRTLPTKGSHGRIGIVTNLGPRLYMVSVPLRVGEHETDPRSLGITMAGKRNPT